MKTLFLRWQDSGNSNSLATIVYSDIILGQTLLRIGDQLKLEYIVNCTISNFSILFNAGSYSNTDISSLLEQGTNLIEITISINTVTTAKGIIKVTNNIGSKFIDFDVTYFNPYSVNQQISLSLQDTSGSPSDNTLIVTYGRGIYIPII